MEPGAYASVLAAAAAVAGIYLVQILVVDVAGIRARHTPGMPVTAGHDSYLFRATRAHANTNENLAVFALLVVVAVLLGADARWTARFAWLFAGARLVHMGAYYADLRALRSVAFGAGLVALIGLLVVAAETLAPA